MSVLWRVLRFFLRGSWKALSVLFFGVLFLIPILWNIAVTVFVFVLDFISRTLVYSAIVNSCKDPMVHLLLDDDDL